MCGKITKCIYETQNVLKDYKMHLRNSKCVERSQNAC